MKKKFMVIQTTYITSLLYTIGNATLITVLLVALCNLTMPVSINLQTFPFILHTQ